MLFTGSKQSKDRICGFLSMDGGGYDSLTQDGQDLRQLSVKGSTIFEFMQDYRHIPVLKTQNDR
jgi:hypothetical protein